MRLRLLILLPLVTLLLGSCLGKRVSVEVADIPFMKWPRAEAIYFYKTVTDTTSPTDISLLLHHGDSFKYNKLSLSIETLAPNQTYWIDNVSINFDTTGPSNYGDTRVRYRTGVRFNQLGTYRFKVTHLMADSVLRGIAGVGIEFE